MSLTNERGMDLKERARETLKNTLVILSLGIAYYLFCTLTNWGLPCPLYSITGILCPGCGLSRMCLAVIRLDFSSALYYNAAFFVLSPIFITIYVSYQYRYIKYGVGSLFSWQKIMLFICIVLLVAFGILRNILDFGLRPNFT